MYLAVLMLFPLLIGIVGLFWTKGRICWKEFLAMEAATFAVLGIGFAIARYTPVSDTEIWNGRIASKAPVRVSCEHSYDCNCRYVRDGKSTRRVCDVCYEHSFDVSWRIATTNGEVLTIPRIDRQGLQEPPRFTKAYVGEATAVAHSYDNYIKASPDSVLRRVNAAEKFAGKLPTYPSSVYDYYRVNRFLDVGAGEPKAKDWNWLLTEANADLGAKRKLNVIVIMAKIADSSYQFAIEEAWLGGKKNDLIVILGVPEYPKIAWVRVTAWSKSEDVKVMVRDAIMDIGTVERRDDIVKAISSIAGERFEHRSMQDFEYLMASAQPGTTGTVVLFALGLIVCGGLAKYFYDNDPFETGRPRYTYRTRYQWR